MPHRINLIPEDAARPEITQAAISVHQVTGVQFRWDVEEAGIGAAEEYEAIPRFARLDGQGRLGRICEGFDFASKTMSGPPDRTCAEPHSRERQ
jgi:hypothetical protein